MDHQDHLDRQEREDLRANRVFRVEVGLVETKDLLGREVLLVHQEGEVLLAHKDHLEPLELSV